MKKLILLAFLVPAISNAQTSPCDLYRLEYTSHELRDGGDFSQEAINTLDRKGYRYLGLRHGDNIPGTKLIQVDALIRETKQGFLHQKLKMEVFAELHHVNQIHDVSSIARTSAETTGSGQLYGRRGQQQQIGVNKVHHSEEAILQALEALPNCQ